MNSWIGRSEAELIESKGPPDREASDGKGGRVLIYVRNTSYASPGTVLPNGAGGYTVLPSQQYNQRHAAMFYVDPRGVIYHWRRE